ncbi:MAG TPA: FAD-dependent oxidoreductase [Thermoanaerobaculia bacterium]
MAVRPVVLLIEPHADHLERARQYLEEDCAKTFDVIALQTFDEARKKLQQLQDKRQPVAVALVRHSQDEQALRDFLVYGKDLFSGMKVILYADEANPRFAVEAKKGGLVDSTVDGAWDAPEVALAPILRDVLRMWETHAAKADVVKVYGDQWLPRCHDVKDLLARHRVPYRWIDLEKNQDEDAPPSPRVVFPDGRTLDDPTDEDLAQVLGFSISPESTFYDLVIVGGGPAGLAAAVYAASEGLRTVIVEKDVPGGQAGASALIENYLGFPDGLSGAELASRAVTQAQKFGTEILLTKHAAELRDDQGYRVIRLDDDTEIVSHAVLLATGVAYRKFEADGAERLTGKGVYYGAAAAEAARFRDQEVCLLGSGNSAAQAALLLARYVRKLTIITIDPSLETTMSRYLVDRIHALQNVALLPQTSVAEVKGADHVEVVVIENLETRERREIETPALFVWIGAKPRTDWVGDTLVRDEQGFILTGRDLKPGQLRSYEDGRSPYLLESSMAGVFVAGDVRHGSVKRVGSAVGEGAMAVQFIHQYLRER